MIALLYVIEVILGVSLIIFVHELGHFVAAKKMGVEVRRFYLGFAPVFTIAGKKIIMRFFSFKKGGTEYGVGMLPLGGFVDMAGESAEDRESETSPNALHNKKPWQRAIIFASGAVMNAVSAFIFFILAFNIGVSFVEPVVGSVEPGSPAWLGGLKENDRITAINNVQTEDFSEVLMAVALTDEGEDVTLSIERKENDSISNIDVSVKPVRDPQGRGMTIGIGVNAEPVVNKVISGSPAEKAGLQEGDRIFSVSYTHPQTGKETIKSISTFMELQSVVSQEKLLGREIKLSVKRSIPDNTQQTKNITLTVATVKHPATKGVYKIGVAQFQLLQIGAVRGDGKASTLFCEGDIITEIDGKEVFSPALLAELADREGIVSIIIQRGESSAEHKLDSQELSTILDDIAFKASQKNSVVGYVQPNKPAEKAGLKAGDAIVEINNEKIISFTDIIKSVSKSEGKPLNVIWERIESDGAMKRYNAVVTPEE
ncbi:MAG: RIP metalloprotease RseP, partial [Planctomycetota bacterium]